MTLYRNIFSNAVSNAIGALIQLILVLMLTRWLNVEDYARFITATAIIGFGEMASDFGVRIWGTRQFSTTTTSNGVLGPILASKAIFSFFLILILAFLPFNLLNTNQVLLTALVACTQPSTDPLLWYLRGNERLDMEALMTLGWRTINASVIGLLAWSGQSITLLLIAWLLSNVIRIIIEWHSPLIRTLTKTMIFKGESVRTQIYQVIKQSLPIGLAFFAMAIYQRLGVLIVGELAPAKTVAHFGAAFTLVASMGFVATSITVSSFPRLARAADAENWQEMRRVVNQKLWMIMFVFLPICLLGILGSRWIIALFYPPTYSEASIAMAALFPGLYISSINFSLKYFMNTLHHNWLDVTSVIFGIAILTITLLSTKTEHLLSTAGIAWGLGEAAIFIAKWSTLKKDARTDGINFKIHILLFVLLFISMLAFTGDLNV